jgi:hypothetical protein
VDELVRSRLPALQSRRETTFRPFASAIGSIFEFLRQAGPPIAKSVNRLGQSIVSKISPRMNISISRLEICFFQLGVSNPAGQTY